MREPYEAADVVELVFEILEEEGLSGMFFDGDFPSLMERVQTLVPAHLFPDLMIDVPLTGEGGCRLAIVYDSYDYRQVVSDGGSFAFCKEAGGLPDLAVPGRVGDYAGFALFDAGTEAFEYSGEAYYPQDLEADPESLLRAAGYCGAFTSELDTACRLLGSLEGAMRIRIADPSDVEVLCAPKMPESFNASSWETRAGEFLGRMREAGFADENAKGLSRICGVYEIPCLLDGKFRKFPLWMVLGYIRIRFREGRCLGAFAGLTASTKTQVARGSTLRPSYSVQWHITDQCDQRCKHCYLFGTDPSIECRSMPYDQLIQTLDSIEEAAARHYRIPHLYITGGDPILHPRFWDFVAEVHRRGFPWSIMGNPFHLDDEACRRLHDLGCRSYQLSLDGNQSFHDRLRKPGSYQATLDAVQTLKDNGVPPTIMATASRENLDDILDVMDTAVEAGVALMGFARYCATSPECAEELYPTPEEYRAFLLAYYEKRRAYRAARCKTTFALKEHLFKLLRWELGEFSVPERFSVPDGTIHDGCHLGQGVCILADGDCMACRRMPSVVGNVGERPYGEIAECAETLRYRSIEGIEGCSDCELWEWCRGCRAVGFNATGDLLGADPMCWHRPVRERA